MELSTEEKITKLLSSKEILRKDKTSPLVTSPEYDFGSFLEKVKNEPSPYGEKYIFIK